MDVLVLIPDDELERLAAERGRGSLEGNSLAELRRERAQDKQVFAYRLGEYIVIGPSRRRTMRWYSCWRTKRRST